MNYLKLIRARYESYLITAALGVALVWQSSNPWWNQWQGRWAVLAFALSVLISFFVAKRTHWSVGPFLAVNLCGAVASFGWSFVARETAYSAFLLLALVLFFTLMNETRERLMLSLAYHTCWWSSGVTLYQLFSGHIPYERMGFVGNASMNGCLIAITLPLAIRYMARSFDPTRCTWITVVLTAAIVSILATETTAPLVVAAVVIVAFCFAIKEYTLLIASLLPLSIGWVLQGRAQLFSDSGRFEYWAQILRWWAQSHTWAFGVGTGTGQVIFPSQAITEHAQKWVMFAHNDYLQALFENGLVGLGAALLMLFYLFVKTFERPWLFASIAGYAICAFFNFPSHVAVHAFFGVMLVWLTYVGEGEYI